MNQGEMVEKVAWEFNLPKAEARRILKFILEEMSKDLMVGERVYFRGFGALHRQKKNSKTVKHPKTGETVKIPERFTVKFNPSKKLEERINEVRESEQ